MMYRPSMTASKPSRDPGSEYAARMTTDRRGGGWLGDSARMPAVHRLERAGYAVPGVQPGVTQHVGVGELEQVPEFLHQDRLVHSPPPDGYALRQRGI
jgi:hypothetical protein